MHHVDLALVRASAEIRIGPAEPSSPCPLQLVDDLARLQVALKRLGWSLRLRTADGQLVELLELVGLDDVLGLEP